MVSQQKKTNVKLFEVVQSCLLKRTKYRYLKRYLELVRCGLGVVHVTYHVRHVLHTKK